MVAARNLAEEATAAETTLPDESTDTALPDETTCDEGDTACEEAAAAAAAAEEVVVDVNEKVTAEAGYKYTIYFLKDRLLEDDSTSFNAI